MNGYFNYKFVGSKEEIKNVESNMEELAKSSSYFKYLLNYKSDIKKENNLYVINFGLKEVCNISRVPFDFEDMMNDLCDEFSDMYIKGTGYYVDLEPYPEWIKEKDDYTYETKMLPINITLTMEEYDKNRDIFIIFVDALGVHRKIPSDVLKNEDGSWKTESVSYTIEEADLELCVTLEL